jgi:putative membrane protein
MKFLFLILGVALLGFVISQTDIVHALSLLRDIGWGFVAIFAIYFIGFLIDAFAWQIATPGVPLDLKWLYRFYQVRVAGEAFNTITPTASMGGEAVKAIMLKRLYGIGYRDGTASLILAKTIIVVALVAFLTVGFALMQDSSKLDDTYKIVSGAGLAAFCLGAIVFVLIQRFKVTTFTGNLLGRSRLFARLNALLKPLHEVEDRLIHFYTRQPNRLVAVFLLSFLNWVIGIFEIWLIMYLIGHPISFSDAWIIETVAQLVRSATFFIPASIGAQEGAFLIVGAAITGQPSFGLTVALARRIREIVWAVWGLAVFYLLKPQIDDVPPAN